MKTDMFVTKKEQLKDWMREKGYFATHDVIKWGLDNFYNRAIQTKGDLKAEGLIRELPEDEKIFRGFKCKDSVYEWLGEKT